MSRKRRAFGVVAAAAAGAALLIAQPALSASAQPNPDSGQAAPARGLYKVLGATNTEQYRQVGQSGVDVLNHSHLGRKASGPGVEFDIVATPEQAATLRSQGYTVNLTGDWAAMLKERSKGDGGQRLAGDFPPGDEKYHTYQEMVDEINKAQSDHPDIAKVSSIGKSHEGRDIPVIKISDNVAQDENEPEVLFTCNMHAREHLTGEMCIRIFNRFTDGYANDPAIKDMVDNREIYIVPMQNPDGIEFDVASGEYQGWRKNRQDQGTDTNRNFDFKWGCCGGSSGNPGAEDYRGPSAASAPEVQAIQKFAESRVVDGKQQIKAHVDFHTFSELVMWPFGWTDNDVAEGMTQEEATRFQTIGKQMADTNGYTPQQLSDLYPTDGTICDYLWGKQRIWSFAFEMYPSGGGIDGFYPPDEKIEPETARNDKAVDILVKAAGEVP
ncbi:carboxypeptidase T [Herbihabitans rhizosphaerae]|uniref:Zinc carboxypeptidase n=1 Tax=Herbihabitans rhizosphaerae TaxID=1872711 RepID=A0A4Q7KIV8_9PSEU|nr:M14 family metallopeptidase [Herbihabitans rhizosphaerae]RZS34878.1 carboxypeptidase T [Herbihabitans rhizosphaerae]